MEVLGTSQGATADDKVEIESVSSLIVGQGRGIEPCDE